MPIFSKRTPPVGARPGTLMLPEGSSAPRVEILRYRGEELEEHADAPVDQARTPTTPGTVTWIHVQGLGDEATLRRLADLFQMHALVLEDVVNAPQRPKVEEYEHHLVLIARLARIGPRLDVEVEQVAILIGTDHVLTFQDRFADVLDPVRRRIREGLGPIRTAGAGYLGYALLDTIVDGYYPVIEQLSEKIEQLETRVLLRPTTRTLDRINQIKSDLVLIRRGIWPQLEATNRTLRDPGRFLSDEVRVYLRDTADHCAQIVDVLDSHRELVNGLMNTYLSVLGQRTNEVMKVLTILASIFIPLTFLAGIYGMNFEFMPELHQRWGYPTLLAIMAAMVIGMLAYFRRRGWLGGDDDADADD